MKKEMVKLVSLIMLSMTIFSCSNNPEPHSHLDKDEDGVCDSCNQVISGKTYSIDEDGFKILEKNYYNDKNHYLNNAYVTDGIEEQPQYEKLKIHIDNKEVPLYTVKTNFSQYWNGNTQTRMDNAVATIGIKGEIEIKLQASFVIFKDYAIRPLANDYHSVLDADRNVLSFKISKAGQYTVEFRSDRVLHLFVNEYDEMNIDYSSHTDWIVFEPGIHNHDNDKRINDYNEINLKTNDIVYICPDAFIQGKFIGVDKCNIKIFGCGYIDGQYFARNADTGEVTVPVEFNFCDHISLNDFSVIDPAGWCFNIYFTNDSTITNCKVISSRSNGDGISIQSCNRITIDRCFVRSWDDSLVVKNYKNWRNGTMGSTDTITFKNCVLWTDLAQSMEIGFETVGEHLENIYFENITVLHNFHKPVFSIHNGNQAKIRNVEYKNIIVEDASMGGGDGKNYLLEFQNIYSTTWSDQYGSFPIGDIDGIYMENITVLNGKANPKMVILGLIDPRSEYPKDPHYVKNVTIKNFKLYGRYVESSDFETNLVENLKVEHD